VNPWRSLENLPREVWLLFTASLVNRAGTMALPFLVLYLTQSLEMSPGEAGLVVGVYGASALIAAPLAGRLVDAIGVLTVLRASLLTSGAALVLMPLGTTFGEVCAATVVWSLSAEAFRPANMAAVSSFVEPARRKTAFAALRLAVNLGMSVGPAVGGFIAEASYPAIFIVDGLTSVAAGVLLFAPSLKATRQAPPRANVGAAHSGPAMRDVRLLLLLTGTMLNGVVFFQHEASMPLYLVHDLALDERIYGLLFTVNTLMIVFMEVALNDAMAHWQHRHALALGALLCGLGFGALGLATGLWGAVFTVVIWTFGEMILFPTMAVYVADIAPPGRLGRYMGLYSMAFGIAFTFAPGLGTVVLDRLGGGVLWGACAMLGVVTAIVFLRLPVVRGQAAHS
jgi:MFS family permease